MSHCRFVLSLCLLLLIGQVPAGPCFGQATAPVTNDRHTHHHNNKFRVARDQSLIHTNRQGADLYTPIDEPMFTFVVFGDRTGGPNEGIDVLAEAVADTNLLEPDLVMTVGDLIQGYNTTPDWMAQMKQFKQVMSELRSPWLPVAGNHDIYWRGDNPPPDEHEASYEEHFGPLWYAFEHKNCWFIVLYTDEGDPETGKKTISQPETQKMSPEQFDWLKGMLKKTADAEHVFVFLHHPRWVGGRYGDDWAKVHAELVKAGNVSAVFAGHFHHMFYEERDGIEYVTLATVGGHQSERAPEAGYLHQFHHVTVRKNQIALASIPVGGTMDVRQITRDVAQMARALSEVVPVVEAPIDVGDDGSSAAYFKVAINNPVDAEIEVELSPSSADNRWVVTPDHFHGKIAANSSAQFTFRALRPTGSLDDYARPLEVSLGMDLLTDTARYAIPVKIDVVPGSIVLPVPEKPQTQRVLVLDGDRAVATVDPRCVGLQDGPITFETFVHASLITDDAGVIAAPGYALSLDGGRPACHVRLDGKWVSAAAPEELLMNPGQTHHLVGEFDGEHLRLYVSGELVTEVPAAGSLTLGKGPITIGADSTPRGPANTLDGWVDQVRISSTARYNGQPYDPSRVPPPDEHTRLLLMMDADQNGYLYDSSGGKAHATLHNGARVDYMK